MEDTESQFERVHVLRQTFRPNEPLQAALAKLVMTGSNGPRSFSIQGSDERLISMSEVGGHQLDIQQRNAERFMATKSNSHFGLEAGVRGRIITPNTRGAVLLQIIMQPANAEQYLHIQEGLDMVQLGRRVKVIGLEAMQLYMNIPVREIQPIPRIKQNLAEMNDILSDESTRRLYHLTPLPYLVGQSIFRPIPKPKDKSYQQTQAS